MNTKKLEFLREIFTEQMNHWMLFPVALAAMGLSGRYSAQGPDMTVWILCGAIPFLCFVIRSRIRRFLPFLLLHVAVILPAFLLPPQGSLDQAICVACGIGYLLHSFWVKMKGEAPYAEPLQPVLGLLLAAVSALLQHYEGEREWDIYYVIPLVFSLGLYALVSYIHQYLDFLSVNDSSAGYLPAAEMFHSGFLLVLGYVCGGAVFLVIAANLGDLSALWELLGRGVKAVLRRFFSLFQTGEEVQEPLPEETSMFPEEFAMFPEEQKPMLFWRILEIVAFVAVAAALVFLLIRGGIFLYHFLRERFARKAGRKEKEAESEECPDVREKCGFSLRDQDAGLGLRERLSPAQRIRRLYKKRILRSAEILAQGKSEKLCLLTPRECGQKLDEEEMAAIYEQVRYSCREATVDTLRQMKNALRKKGG